MIRRKAKGRAPKRELTEGGMPKKGGHKELKRTSQNQGNKKEDSGNQRNHHRPHQNQLRERKTLKSTLH